MTLQSLRLVRNAGRAAAGVALLLAALPAAAQGARPEPSPYVRAVAAGYRAAMLCSAGFLAGRTPAQIDALELSDVYPEYDALVRTLPAHVDRTTGTVSVAWDAAMPPRRAVYAPGRGCTTLPIGAGAPARSFAPTPPGGADPRPWPAGDAGIAPRPSAALAAVVARAFDALSYGEGSRSVGALVVHRGRIVAERYDRGFGPFVANRTWSVGKSLAGAILGHAAHRGRIDVAAPARIPEWGATPADPRAAITIDTLLRMASGLHSDTAGNRTDAVYFGGTGVAEGTGGWPLIAPPGSRFRYANNDTLLAVRALRCALADDAAYADAPASLFARLGMRHTVAEADPRGDFVLSSQVWSTARDLARFGLFLAADGVWDGQRLLPPGWMAASIASTGPQPASGPGYGRTLWLFGPDQGLPAGSYAAQGNRGQYVMVIPASDLVVVRRGEDGTAARFDIARFAADVAAALPTGGGIHR